MFAVLDKHGTVSWLDSGSAPGVMRHNGTQIPWTFDADIGFWLMVKFFEWILTKKITSLLEELLDGCEGCYKLDKTVWALYNSFLEQSKNAHVICLICCST